jgi:hypothetical protein
MPDDRPISEAEIRLLPRWARVAFAARCARRVLPLFAKAWPDVPFFFSEAVRIAVETAEQMAALGDQPYADAAIDAARAATAAIHAAARAAYAADAAAYAADAAAYAADAAARAADADARAADADAKAAARAADAADAADAAARAAEARVAAEAADSRAADPYRAIYAARADVYANVYAVNAADAARAAAEYAVNAADAARAAAEYAAVAAYRAAAVAYRAAEHEMLASIRVDYQRILDLTLLHNWNDKTPVSPSVFDDIDSDVSKDADILRRIKVFQRGRLNKMLLGEQLLALYKALNDYCLARYRHHLPLTQFRELLLKHSGGESS